MQTILDMLRKAGGWHPGLYLRIDHAPYMELVIEAMNESGSCGLPALSVCHYGQQNGDAMRDPEMCFELSFAGGEADLNPFYWRNDYVAIEQWSRFVTGSDYAFHRALYQQHIAFAKVWDRNLRSQGFAEAFDTARHVRG